MYYRHNQVQLTGRIAHKPDFRFSSDGTPHCRLFLLQDNGKERPPHRFTLVGWAGLAQRLYEVVRSGDRLFVQGELRTRTVGPENERQLLTEIHLEQFVLLKSPRSSNRLLEQRQQAGQPTS